MKNNFIKSIVFLCLIGVIACKEDSNKKSEKKTPETESVAKPSADKQKEIRELNIALEDFDENYSMLLKGFYQAMNDVNAFAKDAKKDDTQKERILNNLSQLPKSDKPIKVPKNLKSEYQSSVDTLEGIYSEFTSLQEKLRNYVESEVWKENNRNKIYQLGEKAETLSRKYEHTFNKLNAELQ